MQIKVKSRGGIKIVATERIYAPQGGNIHENETEIDLTPEQAKWVADELLGILNKRRIKRMMAECKKRMNKMVYKGE